MSSHVHKISSKRSSIIVGVNALTTISVEALRNAATLLEKEDVDLEAAISMLRRKADSLKDIGRGLVEECVDLFSDEVWGQQPR